jgi:hypothetical protein
LIADYLAMPIRQLPLLIISLMTFSPLKAFNKYISLLRFASQPQRERCQRRGYAASAS